MCGSDLMAADGPARVRSALLTRPENKAAHSHRSGEFALVTAVLLAACGHLLLKAGMLGAGAKVAHAPLSETLVKYLLTPEIILGLAVYGLGTAMWVVAVSRRDISYLFPITAINYVLVTVGGMRLFGEIVPVGRWTGILIVVCGVALLQLSAKERGK